MRHPRKAQPLLFQLFTRVVAPLMIGFALFQAGLLGYWSGIVESNMMESMTSIYKQTYDNLVLFNHQLVYTISQSELDESLYPYLDNKYEDNYTLYHNKQAVSNYFTRFSGFTSTYGIQFILLGNNGQAYTSIDNRLIISPEELRALPISTKAEENSRLVVTEYGARPLLYNDSSSMVIIAKNIRQYVTNRSHGFLYICLPCNVYDKFFLPKSDSERMFYVTREDGTVVAGDSAGFSMIPNELLPAAQPEEGGGQQPGRVKMDGQNFLVISRKMSLGNARLTEMMKADALNSRKNAVFASILLVTFLFILISSFAVFRTAGRITGPIKKLSRHMREYTQNSSSSFQYDDASGCEEAVIAAESFNQMISRIDSAMEEIKTQNEARRIAEISSLQMQIRPHFIYNSLSSVKYLASLGRIQAVCDHCDSLSALLRMTLGNTDEQITFGKELELTRHYMNLQTSHHGDKVQFSIIADESTYDIYVPKLILQPLVENSLFHGFTDLSSAGSIRIVAALRKDAAGEELHVDVIDDGIGMQKELVDRLLTQADDESDKEHFNGIGLRNVNDRLKMIYGPEYGIKIYSEENYGTQISLIIPAKHAEKEKAHV